MVPSLISLESPWELQLMQPQRSPLSPSTVVTKMGHRRISSREQYEFILPEASSSKWK